jgi:hypothetical protein
LGGLRPRELLTNWLVCVAFNDECESPERLTFTSDPTGGDGILLDTQTKETFATEHVIVPAAPKGKTVDGEALILKAIQAKNKKGGPAYASGKTLFVFLNAGAGAWSPNSVTKQLPDPLHFSVVWVVGLHRVESEYIYGVTQIGLERRQCADVPYPHRQQFQFVDDGENSVDDDSWASDERGHGSVLRRLCIVALGVGALSHIV